MRKFSLPFLFLTSLLVWSSSAKAFMPGDLDLSFNFTGLLTTDFYGLSETARAVVLQPDGKIVVAGAVTLDMFMDRIGLTRYNPDGTLDPTFGVGGKVVTKIDKRVGSHDRADAMTLQPDGKILVAGTTSEPFSLIRPDQKSLFAIVRYNTDGSLDDAFGTGGVVTTGFADNFTNEAKAIAFVSGEGRKRILVAGTTSTRGGSRDSTYVNCDFALARYNLQGKPDPSFGTGGQVTTDFFKSGAVAEAIVVREASGEILVGGYAREKKAKAVDSGSFWDTYDSYFALASYNSGGKLNVEFGKGGKVTTDVVGKKDNEARAIALQPDGMILLGGFANDYFAMARYQPDGRLDPTFGENGKVTTKFGPPYSSWADAVVIQPDGKIVLSGEVMSFPPFSAEFALARYDSKGVLDPTFGAGGLVTTSFGIGAYSAASAATLQPDGKIVLVGLALTPGVYDFALARYCLYAVSSSPDPESECEDGP